MVKWKDKRGMHIQKIGQGDDQVGIFKHPLEF